MKAPPVKAKNIPECIKTIDSWLLWRLKKGTKADGTETWLKVPYYADGTKRRGALGTKQDRAKLVSFDEAMQVYGNGNYAGVGFATMPEYPLTILDIDSCVKDDGSFSDFGAQVVDTGTYVEYSPSLRGLRAIFTGTAICAGKRNGLIENGERIEIYCGSAFVTITGHRVSKTVTPKRLPKLIRQVLEPVVQGSGTGGEEARREVDGDVLMSPDAAPLPEFTIEHARKVLNKLPESWGQPGHGTWYRVAAALHLQFDGSDEAYQLLDEWSQGLDGYDQENNRKRWEAGFAHAQGKSALTTMRNLVFEARDKGGLRIKHDTMKKWGLARSVEEDFGEEDDDDKDKSALPEFSDLNLLMDIGRFVDKKAAPIEWLVEGLLPRGVVSMLAGASGTSKSFLALQMCAHAAVGWKQFAGLKIKEGGFCSAYFFYEDPDILVHRRIEDVAKTVIEGSAVLDEPEELEEAKDKLRSNLLVLTADVLDNGDWQFVRKNKKFDEAKVTKLADYLREFIEARGIDLLVLDTGSEIHAAEENSAPEMVVLMRVLRQLASSTNIAVLVIQHVSKLQMEKRLSEINQSAIRGSSVLVDKSRNVFYLSRMPKIDAPLFGLEGSTETNEQYVVLKHLKANMGEYVKQRVFERGNRGLLLYRDSIVEQDPGFVDTENERDQKREARKEVIRAEIVAYVKERNDKGETPSSGQIRTYVVNTHNRPEEAVKDQLKYLEMQDQLRRSKNPEYRHSAAWVVPNHKLAKQYEAKEGPATLKYPKAALQ